MILDVIKFPYFIRILDVTEFFYITKIPLLDITKLCYITGIPLHYIAMWRNKIPKILLLEFHYVTLQNAITLPFIDVTKIPLPEFNYTIRTFYIWKPYLFLHIQDHFGISCLTVIFLFK